MDIAMPPLPEPPEPAGELVACDGRHAGARRPLASPLTLLGQAPGCDIPLSGDGVAPLHCAIFAGPAGLLLRHLDAETATLVNGQPVTTARLRDQDEVEVGPCRFRVALGAPPSTAEGPSAGAVLLDHEREALQIQISAVAAQHAALTEDEARLDARAAALERQEAQLAAHFEEQQRQLDEQQQALTARAEEAERQRAELAEQAAEAARGADALARQRARVADLRRRLVKRYRRHWQDQQARAARREAELARGREALQRERAAVRAFHEKVNGELELGRRQLREEWRELGLAQQQWDEALNAERAEQGRRRAELEAAAKAAAEQRRAAEALAREADGLEARVRHGRARLTALRREGAEAAAPADAEALARALLPAATAGVALADWPRELRELAGAVADQRAHLVEQWQRLLATQEAWQRARAEALAELAPVAAELERRERALAAEHRRLTAAQAALDQQRQRLEAARGALEGRQARQALHEASFQAERGRLLVHLGERERLLEVRGRLLHDVQRRRNARRAQEREALAAAREQCDEARRQYAALWRECEELRGQLARQETALAGKALALERYRQELIHRAPDSPAAEARIARLEGRERARLAEEAHELAARRRALLAEAARLDELADALRERDDELDGRERELARLEEASEAARQAALAEAPRHEAEANELRERLVVEGRHLRQVRDELERLARSLIDDAEAAAVPRAA